MNTWAFQIRGEGSKTLDLDIYDVIGEGFLFRGVTARQVRQVLKDNASAELVRVRINSRGGDVVDGTAIYNLLVQHSARVEIDIDGIAASMASVIAMAGDEIRMAATAYVMIHNPWGLAIGEADEMQRMAELLDKMRGQLADAYVARTGLARAEVLAMMDAETWMTAKEAKEKGFVDKVIPAKKRDQKMAAAAAFACADLGAYRNLPDDLRAAIDAARSSAGPTPPAAGRDEEVPDTGDKERKTMPISKLILATLGLNDDADEKSVVAAINTLRDRDALATKFEQATGTTGDAALGVAQAWKDSHEKLPAVQGELAQTRATSERAELDGLIKAGRAEHKLTKASADKLQAQVEAFWKAKAEGKEPEGDAMSLAAAKSFVATLSPISRHVAKTEDDKPEHGGGAALTYNGKSYEDLSNVERAELAELDPELFRAMRLDWKKRGEPERAAKS